MAKKDEKDEDEKKAKKAGEKDDDEKDEPSTDVDIEIEGEEKDKPKKEVKKEEEEVEVEPEGESPEDKEQRLSKSQQRKQRQREARDAKEREIAALRSQNAELVNRVSAIEQKGFSADVGRIETGLYEAEQQMREAKDIIKRATEEKNGEALAQAQEAWYDARRRAEQLTSLKQNMAAKAREPQVQAPDPLLVRHAKDWMSKNRWYDPRGYDQDSKIALSIDQSLANDGWDPKTQEYWEEFSARVSKYLPHRTNGKKPEEEEEEESSPTRGSGRESGGGSVKTTFRVSKDRVDALKEAGQWDQFNSDKTFRARMIKRFKEADEKHAAK